MTFYSKLTRELKRQFKESDIPIPETRAKCVAVAQRIWEGLHGPDERKSLEDYKDSRRKSFESYKSSREKDYKDSKEKDDYRSKYPSVDSRRDRKDRYRLGHRHRDDWNKDKDGRRSSPEKEVICFKCNKPGHYAPNCPDQKGSEKKAKIQSTQKDRSQASSRSSSRSSSPSSSQSSSEAPRALSDSDSSDSLN
jgi:hypothetical protein